MLAQVVTPPEARVDARARCMDDHVEPGQPLFSACDQRVEEELARERAYETNLPGASDLTCTIELPS